MSTALSLYTEPLILDPTAYPYFDLYPTLSNIRSRGSQQEESAKDIVNSALVDLAGTYPYICPYPPAYPHFDLYPRVQIHASRNHVSLTRFLTDESGGDTANSKFSVSAYPFLVIYHHVYPHINLYPARAADTVSREEDTNNKLVVSSSMYPFLVIYPHVYPHFNLYPSRAAELYATNATHPKSPADPPVYPYFDLYPGFPPRVDAPAASGTSTVIMDHGYPVLNIYPAVYPHSLV
ncbi:hypothetical protein BD769DRAFT_1669445 [Suillus cothurnatus]|nr:hypothetical protein BD769DRAFT_1669445 [Suillus cothurnatus]